jgi:hypothetical protein
MISKMNKAIILLYLPLITLAQSKKKIQTSFAPGPVSSSQLNTPVTTGLSTLASFGYHFSEKWAPWGVVDSKLLHTQKRKAIIVSGIKFGSVPLAAGATYSIKIKSALTEAVLQ